MSQYHNIMWMWYCDIRPKLLEQKGNILGKVLYFYVILCYCDILTKELWPNITISHGCDIVIFYQNCSSKMSQYHNITWDVILWYSIKIVRAILKYSE